MSYWSATDEFLQKNGGNPKCPNCGSEMFPQDDHGRFICFCSLGGGFDAVTNTRMHTLGIPQVDASGLSDEEKAKISPINRLNSAMTSAEQRVANFLMQGLKAMDSLEYVEACEALKKERSK
jgi:phage/plasmid primase-like uncharacterized protein